MVGIVVSVILGSIGTLNLVNVILTGVIARQREFAAMRSIGMTKKQLTMILDGYGELLYQDGLSAFAIGSLTTEEELFVQKYKVLSIYSETAKRFVPPAEKVRHGADRIILSPHGIRSPRRNPARRAARDCRSDRAGYD